METKEAWKVLRAEDGILALFDEEITVTDRDTVKLSILEEGIFLTVGDDKRIYLNPAMIKHLRDKPKIFLIYSPVRFYDVANWAGIVEVDSEVMDKLLFTLEMMRIESEGAKGEESSSPENENGPSGSVGN